jgi:uncharacterized membrane protein YqjE
MERTPIEERPGIVDSLSATAATVVAIVHTRLDLLSTDLEEEREHFVSLTLFALGAFFCLGVGVVLMASLLVFAVWDSHRLLALGALAATFLTAGAAAIAVALKKVKAKPRLFAASLAELRKDRQLLAPTRP